MRCTDPTPNPVAPWLAARLRQRKAELLRRFPIPDLLLPGSLSQSDLRCGKPTCHCANPMDPGHPIWTLTFMAGGKKHIQHIPKERIQQVQRHVQAGRPFQDAVREVPAASAQLLALARRQRLPHPGAFPARVDCGRLSPASWV